MSRGCYKAYGRKVAPSTHAQFEKLFTESTNKPCAAKSAGTVGKWGITSFTSIRSISLGQGYNGKRSRDKGKNNNVTDDPGEEPIKPKKFFKSRVDDSKGKPLPPVPIPVPPSLTKQYSRPPARSPPTRAPRSPKSPPPPKAPRSPAPPRSPSRPTRLASLVAQRKLVDTLEDEEIDDDIFQTKAINLTSHLAMRPPSPPPRPAPSPSPPPQVEEEEPSPSPAHPPIVLRICKGTAQIITPNLTDDESTPSSQHKKEGRRRSYNSDSNDSATPPKKHKKKYQDYERREAEREREREREKEKEKEREREKEAEVVEEPMAVEPVEPLPPPQVEPQPVIDPNDELRKLQELKATLEGSPAPPQPEIEEPIDQSVPENLVSSIPEQEYEPTSQEVEEKTAEAEEAYPTPAAEEGYSEEAKMYDQEPGLEAAMTEESQEVRPQEVGVIQKVEPLVLRRPPGRAPKKGSIFKSRGASGEKRNAHYIHKWCDQKEEGSKGQNKAESVQASSLADEFESETLTRVTKYSGEEETAEEECEPITSVTCSKKAKEFYTVVRNVKKAHQIQESGEFQEFNDDVEYILDALQDNNPISTRCLSAITLASKCMVPAFRMHVRAHGTVTKFFRALHDATKDQRLGMCTATVMFVLSQDRLNMDIDRDSLELMLSLLESDASHSSALEGCGLSTAELKKTKDRVRSLCQEIQEQGHARHLNLDNITVGQLAMETLLSLTSKRAGEWFKEELRDLGGLEHIVKTVVETCRPIDHTVVEWTAPLLDRLKKADRCLRVLENVTLQNEENNNYLLRYGQGILVDTVIRVMRVCDSHIPYFPTVTLADKESPGAIIRECLIAILKVLINLTHDFNNKSYGSSLAGMREGLIDSSLHVLLEIPRYIPEEQKFDVMVLTLILLINLVEHCQANRRLLIEAKAPLSHNPVITISGGSAVSALVQMFLEQEELARTVERKTDAILDGKEGDEKKQEVSKSHEEFIEETVALLLQKAGRHMEHTLIGAYIALLLGYLIVENQIFEEYVRSHMPNNNYDLLLSVLQKFLNFMKLTSSAGSGSSRGLKATELLIKQLQEIDEAINANQQQDVPTDYSTSALS